MLQNEKKAPLAATPINTKTPSAPKPADAKEKEATPKK
jgi:hypothetical protein